MSKLGRHKEAVEKYVISVEFDQENASAYFNWGFTLEELGLLPEAIEKYRKAVEKDPDGEFGEKAKIRIEALKKNQ